MKRFLLAAAFACVSVTAASKTVEANWPLMSYVGFMQSNAASSVQQSAGAQGITFPGLLVFNEQGALVYAGPAKPVTSGSVDALNAEPLVGAAQLSTIIAEFDNAEVNGKIDAAKPTLVVVVLGGARGESCTNCGTVLAELAPFIEKGGRSWNIVEATVSAQEQD